jgi:chemotaxis protein MotB
MADGTPIIIKKKKVVGHGGHHGGSWKVAYADFVTAMMAFFMVMWILGLSASTKAQIQGYFNDPLGFTKNEPKADVNIVRFASGPPKTVTSQGKSAGDTDSAMKRDEDQIRALEKKIEKAVSSGGADLSKLLKNIEFEVTDEGLRIEMIEASGSVFFQSGSAAIRPEARKLVARIAPLVVKSGRGIVIEGHTDSMPYPGNGYNNWDLSTDRASAMRRLLQAVGVPLKRFIQVRGYADTQLRNPSKPYHYSNRRVTILLPFHSVSDTLIGMPKEDLQNRIQGVFRRPVEVAPEHPDVSKEGQ